MSAEKNSNVGEVECIRCGWRSNVLGDCSCPSDGEDRATQIRDQLAEHLRHHQGSADTADELADVLLPVVEVIANRRAAEELEAEAAYDEQAPDEQYARYLFARRLRVRAKNLRSDSVYT